MEFLTTKQKKKKAQQLYLGYALLSVLVILATYVLISTALGFDVLTPKGVVVQNGLLFIDSRPDNAEVYLNGRRESNNTNAKYTLPEAEYAVQLKKTGYHDWNGSVSLMGGTVEFLTYPRLMPTVPQELTSSQLVSAPESLQSLDKRWLATINEQIPGSVTIQDLDKPLDPFVSGTIPVSISGGKAILSMQLLAWADDDEHFMVMMRLADTPTPQFLIMNRQRLDEITNVSALFNVGSDDTVGFWNEKRDQVYIKQPSGVVLLGDVDEKSLSAQSLMADPAREFFPITKERALYTTLVGSDMQVKYYNNGKTFVVNTLKDPSKPVIAKVFNYNRNEYMLIAGEGFEKTLIYRNFEKSATESITGRAAPFYMMPEQSTTADVSRSNRFVMGSRNNDVQVYDIERKELSQFEIPSSRPATIGWFDDVRLYAVGADTSLSVFDFTGKNVYGIASSTVKKPFVSADIKKAYYWQKTSDTMVNAKAIDIDSPSE